MPNRQAAVVATRQRIIASAASLFAQGGYNGTGTRDIARNANINEATIFRHYPHKRDLYIAVLESELQKVRLRGDLLAEVADAPDTRAALASVYTLITATLTENPGLLRLLQFGSLELGKDFDSLLRKHLRELVDVLGSYLQPWIDSGQMQCNNAKAIVLTLVAITLYSRFLYPAFGKGSSDVATVHDLHADVYSAISMTFPD